MARKPTWAPTAVGGLGRRELVVPCPEPALSNTRYTHLPTVCIDAWGRRIPLGAKKIRNPTLDEGVIHVEPMQEQGYNDQFPWSR